MSVHQLKPMTAYQLNDELQQEMRRALDRAYASGARFGYDEGFGRGEIVGSNLAWKAALRWIDSAAGIGFLVGIGLGAIAWEIARTTLGWWSG